MGRALAAAACVLAALTTLGASGCARSHATPTAAPAPPAPAPASAAPLTGAPRCTAATAPAPALGRSRISMVRIGVDPFGIMAALDGPWVFVASPSAGVEVLRTGSRPGLTLAHTVPAGAVLGETLADGGRYLLAAAGTGAGLLPAGRFPREMAPEPGGRTLLVTNFASGQVELVNVAGLP